MPEMPEVETIRRNLEKRIVEQTIRSLDVRLARQVRYPCTVEGFLSRTEGQKIVRIGRRGKYLLVYLQSEIILVIHLGMTGKLYYDNGEQMANDRHVRILFMLNEEEYLVFSDMRTFGGVYAMTEEELPQITGLVSMGPEPLSEEFTTDYLGCALAKKQVPIKAFLLDQRKIGGIGNIYADEALFLAHIYPERACGSLNEEEICALHAAVNRVIADGIEDGGTTFRDYRNGEGEKGSHQEHLWVYSRGGETCRLCGGKIEKIVVGGRGTHFCKTCQK